MRWSMAPAALVWYHIQQCTASMRRGEADAHAVLCGCVDCYHGNNWEQTRSTIYSKWWISMHWRRLSVDMLLNGCIASILVTRRMSDMHVSFLVQWGIPGEAGPRRGFEGCCNGGVGVVSTYCPSGCKHLLCIQFTTLKANSAKGSRQGCASAHQVGS